MSKTKKVLIVILVILAILFVPIRITYKDGGTRTYSALTYKYIRWQRLSDEIDEPDYTGTSLYWFPDNFMTIDQLYELEVGKQTFTIFAGGNSGEMPGGICPAIKVNDKVYKYSGLSQKTVTFQDGKTSTVSGDTYLPDGYVKVGDIASITRNKPTKNLQLQAGDNATGSVYANKKIPEVVYVLLKTSWMVNENCYCKFMSDELYDSQCFCYDGNYYRITSGIYDDTEIVKELPKESVVIGKLKYIGEDYVPSSDFETNCRQDCYGYSLDGRDVLFSAKDEGYLYVYMKSFWAEGAYDSWYCCHKL